MFPTQQGQIAESYACEYLQRAGLTLVTRNYRCRYGELDIIMQQKNLLIFVEVRYRANMAFGSPIETITAPKRQRLQRSAHQYLQEHDQQQRYDWRFDCLGLSPGSQPGAFVVEWIPNAWELDD